MALFSASDWASIQRAIAQETAEARKGAQSLWLDIDAIEHVQQASGRYIYRLLLSQPTRLEPEQTITFTSRSKDKIRAVVVASTDNELVVDCEAPLPDDARLQHVELDASFIYDALLKFLSEKAEASGFHARMLVGRRLPDCAERAAAPVIGDLNSDQCRSIAAMSADPVHLLWGPPGTGKTTTLGAAVSSWMSRGKTVLLLSTSNAAVDTAVKSLLKRLSPSDRGAVLRLGTSTDREVEAMTVGGKFARTNTFRAGEVAAAQERLRSISEIVAMRPTAHDELARLFAERQRLEQVVARYNETVVAATDAITVGTKVYACTLARMVLDKLIRGRTFDVVVVDEASMVSILYGFAAALLTGANLVFAGDPKQLPPIVQSDDDDALRWFGHNIFTWLRVDEHSLAASVPMTLLRTQYRMTDRIGGIVSRLSYGERLSHGRGVPGVKPILVDLPAAWQTRLWSVREHSYYQPASIPLVHALIQVLGGERKELLLLTPFRAQHSLLAALAFDLTALHPEWDIRSSTIHRSQGSERHTVIVDLTTHSPTQLSSFFEDRSGELLFNVAISRAQNNLVILGSQAMLHALATARPFWKRAVVEVLNECDAYTADEILEDADRYLTLSSVFESCTEQKGVPALCCCQGERPSAEELQLLQRVAAGRKLLVAKETSDVTGGFVIRSSNLPYTPMFVAQGRMAFPHEGQWLTVDSPAVSRVLWRVGFSHLADEEVNPNEARRFFCPRCVPGELRLRRSPAGWILTCSEYPRACTYTRHLSLEDAKAKVRLQGMTCPNGHPLTARAGAKGIFLGCENYPHCDHTSPISILAGV